MDKIISKSGKADEEIAECRRIVLHWKDIEAVATTLPEYEEKARLLIKNYLGYLPPLPSIYIPYEPYIRSLIAGLEGGVLSETLFAAEAAFTMKKIRNDDMQKHGWAKEAAFTKEDYEYYETHLSLFKQAAKERLQQLLGYQPAQEHALGAETYLRQLFTMEEYHADMPYCSMDYRAMTICRYRQHLLVEGRQSAEESPLLGISLCALNHVQPYSFLK